MNENIFLFSYQAMRTRPQSTSDGSENSMQNTEIDARKTEWLA